MSNYRLVTILNTAYEPVLFKSEGKPHYQIFLSVEPNKGHTLDDFTYAEYELHKTFKNRIRRSTDKSSGFRIELIAWGIFRVKVKLYKEDGKFVEFEQSMRDNFRREAVSY